jgi:MFS superfamily sulfate permease-like transporter
MVSHNLIFNVTNINYFSFLAFSGIILLFLLQILNSKWTKHYPIPSSLVFVIVFIFLGYQTKMDRQPYNVPVVGTIPMGLPKPQAFSFESTLLLPVAKQALSYALVYFLMHVSVVNRFAQKHGYLVSSFNTDFDKSIAWYFNVVLD